MGGWSRPQRFCDICGWWRLAGHHRRALDSARLVPCASSFSEEVVEGTHDIMAEGTGLEPYSPCQGLVRGQGGLQDVQACVDLPVHFPVAHQADEILAYPISAPGAIRWAGLAGPLRVDLDDGHAREGGLVLNLAMDFASRPRVQAAVHPVRASACSVERQVLEDDCRSTCCRRPHEPLRHSMQPLPNSVPLSAPFSTEENLLDPSVLGLFLCESPSSSEMGFLDAPHAIEGHAEETRRIARRLDPVE